MMLADWLQHAACDALGSKRRRHEDHAITADEKVGDDSLLRLQGSEG
jgi:hypothetical protein